MWFTEVKAKAKRKNQMLFSKDSVLLDDCKDAVEHRVRYYEQRLHYWVEREKSCSQNWASFLRK